MSLIEGDIVFRKLKDLFARGVKQGLTDFAEEYQEKPDVHAGGAVAAAKNATIVWDNPALEFDGDILTIGGWAFVNTTKVGDGEPYIGYEQLACITPLAAIADVVDLENADSATITVKLTENKPHYTCMNFRFGNETQELETTF